MYALSLILAILGSLRPEAPAPSDPMIRLHIYVPFDFVGSNNAPDFVLYNNGVAIYQIEDSIVATVDTEATYPTFATSRLDAATIANLRSLATSAGFLALSPRYDLDPQGSEWDINILQVWSGPSMKRVWVRGPPTRWPPPFASLFAAVSHFHQQNERPWHPDSIEIELTRVEQPCLATDPVQWPTELSFPDTPTDSTVVRYRVPYAQLPVVQRVWRASGNYSCTPIAIGHSHWLLWYRYPFPGESAWYPL